MISGMYGFHHADDFFSPRSVKKLVIGTEPQGQCQLSTDRDVELLSPHNFSLIIVTVFLIVYCSFLGALLLHACEIAYFQEGA